MQQTIIHSNSKILRVAAFVTAVLLFTAVITTRTHARPTYNVELISFTATALPNGVRLTWETATEDETAGYILQREEDDQFVDLLELTDANGQPYQDGIIDAMGSPTVGAIYVANDLTAVSGQTYTYQLIEIEGNSNLVVIGNVTVTAGQTTPTATLISVGNNTPVGSSQSPTPANTVPATATNNPAATTAATATTVRTFITATPPSATINQETAAGQSQPTAVPRTAVPANNSNPPTNSPTNSQPEPQLAPPANTDGVAFAQELETPVGYPGPENGYPEELATALPLDSTASPYPVGSIPQSDNPTPTIIGVIGSQTGQTESDTAVNASSINSQTNSSSSTAILWLGFLVGGIIFAAAIYGSIRLFARRRA